MWKMFSIAVLAIFASLSLCSCKKNYTCKCSVTTAGTVITQDIALDKTTKKDANNFCKSTERDYNIGGGTASCKVE